MPRLTVGTDKNVPVSIHYEDYGEGRPIVLIHGWPLSGRSFEPQIGPLVDAGYRVITYDRRGFGMSSQPWIGYDYETLTTDLNALMDQLGLRDATLLGFSMGGGEVARYAGAYGAGRQISQIVLAAAIPPYLYLTPDNPDGVLSDAMIDEWEAGIRADRPAFVDDFCAKFFTANGEMLVSEQMRHYMAGLAERASPQGTLACVHAFARTDFRPDLAAVDVPTLIIHGDADELIPFEHSGMRTHKEIPGSRLNVIEGGPHGINVTHTETFNGELLDFLAG